MRELEPQECITCFVEFGVPKGFTQRRRDDKENFYCPNGHAMSYHESELDRVRRERDSLKQDAARLHESIKTWRDEASQNRKQATALRGQVTKLKKRSSAGVCPCCNRTFSQLARHMAQKHRGFIVEPLADSNVIPLKAAQ